MFNSSPFERITALTDLLVGALAVYVTMQFGEAGNFKMLIWRSTFGLLAFASILGAAVHGFGLHVSTRALIWKPLNLSLALALSLFVVGAMNDVWGQEMARKALPYMFGFGAAFFTATLFLPETFLNILIYEAVAMFFALFAYGNFFLRGTLPGAGWMTLGIMTTIFAAIVQGTGKAGTPIIWYFDNNGVFHVTQMAGLWMLMVGLQKSF